MKKKIIVTIVIVIAIAIILLNVKSEYRKHQNEQYTNIRTEMVTHMIENVNLYEKELKALGYDYEIVFDDLEFDKKLGYQERGVIRLLLDNTIYEFDRGLDSISVDLGEDVKFRMGARNDTSLSLNCTDYPIAVLLEAPEYDRSQGKHAPFNSYNIDFTEFRIVWDGEMSDDYRIKKYVSTEALQETLSKGIELENKLFELYEEKGKETE